MSEIEIPDWEREFLERQAPEDKFAAMVRNGLRDRSMRQEDLAKAMGALGVHVHPSAISKMVNPLGRQREIRLPEAVAMASVLKLDLQSLVPAFACGRCGDGPPAGFTCNACGRAS